MLRVASRAAVSTAKNLAASFQATDHRVRSRRDMRRERGGGALLGIDAVVEVLGDAIFDIYHH